MVHIGPVVVTIRAPRIGRKVGYTENKLLGAIVGLVVAARFKDRTEYSSEDVCSRSRQREARYESAGVEDETERGEHSDNRNRGMASVQNSGELVVKMHWNM